MHLLEINAKHPAVEGWVGFCFRGVEKEAELKFPLKHCKDHLSYQVYRARFYKPGIVQSKGMENTRHASAQLRSLPWLPLPAG